MTELTSAPMIQRESRGLARRLLPVLILAGLVSVPFVASSYYTQFVSGVLILAIFAMSLDLVLGYTGQMSFGSAAFFGLGAYSVVLLGLSFDLNAWIGLLASMVVASIAAVSIGYFCTRVNGIRAATLFCRRQMARPDEWQRWHRRDQSPLDTWMVSR
jgi:ABC-type branched-subunit amino acid transport system permease subunit